MEVGLVVNIIDIGPECFTDENMAVICYKGENYYRACGELVAEHLADGGKSYCVKPVAHAGVAHEDFEGRMVSNGDRVYYEAPEE